MFIDAFSSSRHSEAFLSSLTTPRQKCPWPQFQADLIASKARAFQGGIASDVLLHASNASDEYQLTSSLKNKLSLPNTLETRRLRSSIKKLPGFTIKCKTSLKNLPATKILAYFALPSNKGKIFHNILRHVQRLVLILIIRSKLSFRSNLLDHYTLHRLERLHRRRGRP